MPSKRINQLDPVYKVNDGDLLAVDVQGMSETRKVTKASLLQEYVVDAPKEVATQDWYWARRNGQWYRIYPDEYVFEAPMDGGIYVRVNGKWAKVTGVSGDMLQSIYDTRVRSEDIFNFVIRSLTELNEASESLFGFNVIRTGDRITKEFSIARPLKELMIHGETIEIRTNEYGTKSFDYPDILEGVDNLRLFVSGKDIYRGQKLVKGSYTDPNTKTIIHTFDSIKVNAGETYTLQYGDTLAITVVGTDEFNNLTGYQSTELVKGNSITIPDGVEYVGVQIRDYKIVDGEFVYNDLVEPYSVYARFIFPIEDRFQQYDLTFSKPLYNIPNVTADFIDFAQKKEIHNVAEMVVNNLNPWEITPSTDISRGQTIMFKLPVEASLTVWNDPQKNYAYSDVLENKSYGNLVPSDMEGIALFEGAIYTRVLYSRFTNNPANPDASLVLDFKQFLSTHPITILYQAVEPMEATPIAVPDIELYDGVTTLYNETTVTYNNTNYNVNLNMIATFDPVIDHLVRKRGDWIDGELGVRGGIKTPKITGIGQDDVDAPLYINPDNRERMYINDNNQILDRRDFSTDPTSGRASEWEPEVETIQEKEADDNRVVNTAYLKRDYAPLDSPPLVGTPTAPKAETRGTNQIATGEFVEENYYNKDKADENYIHTTDGIAKGDLILDEVIPGNEDNVKRIPNIEYIKDQYYDKAYTDDTFAPLISPALEGVPTTPTPDGAELTQITNVEWVEDNFVNQAGDTMTGTLNVRPYDSAYVNIKNLIDTTVPSWNVSDTVFIFTTSIEDDADPFNPTMSFDKPSNSIFEGNVSFGGIGNYDSRITVELTDYIRMNYKQYTTSISGYLADFSVINNANPEADQLFTPDYTFILTSYDPNTHAEVLSLPLQPGSYTINPSNFTPPGMDIVDVKISLQIYVSINIINEVISGFSPYGSLSLINSGNPDYIKYHTEFNWVPANTPLTVKTSDTGDKAVVTDSDSNLVPSQITTTELNALKGIKSNVQGQLDNIPKYDYKEGLTVNVDSPTWPTQQALNVIALPVLQAAYPNAELWWAVTVEFVLQPSGEKRDCLYYFNPENTEPASANLAVKLTQPGTANGITWRPRSDGSVSVEGTATAANNTLIPLATVGFKLPIDTYTTTITNGQPNAAFIMSVPNKGYGLPFDSSGNFATTFNITSSNGSGTVSQYGMSFKPVVDTTYNLRIYPMINQGSTALPYVPYSGANPGWTYLYTLTTTITLANGTVPGVVKNSPDISYTDGQGVVNHSKTADTAVAASKVEWSNVLNAPSAFPELAHASTLTDLNQLTGDSNTGQMFRFAATVLNKPVPKRETQPEPGTCTVELIKTPTGYLQLYYNDVTYSAYKRYYNTTTQSWSAWAEFGGGEGSVTKVNNVEPDFYGNVPATQEITEAAYNALQAAGQINPNVTYFVTDSQTVAYVIESGANENGAYIKYPDGTLVCTKAIPTTFAFTNSTGALWQTTVTSLGLWSMEFIEPPIVNITPSVGGWNVMLFTYRALSAINVGEAIFGSTVTNAGVNGIIYITATGRWKPYPDEAQPIIGENYTLYPGIGVEQTGEYEYTTRAWTPDEEELIGIYRGMDIRVNNSGEFLPGETFHIQLKVTGYSVTPTSNALLYGELQDPFNEFAYDIINTSSDTDGNIDVTFTIKPSAEWSDSFGANDKHAWRIALPISDTVGNKTQIVLFEKIS